MHGWKNSSRDVKPAVFILFAAIGFIFIFFTVLVWEALQANFYRVIRIDAVSVKKIPKLRIARRSVLKNASNETLLLVKQIPIFHE